MTRYETIDSDGHLAYICGNCLEYEHNKCNAEDCQCNSCFDELGEYE